MGKPLKPAWRETPILYGEDARRFMKRIENPPKWSNKKKKEFQKWCEVFDKTFVQS